MILLLIMKTFCPWVVFPLRILVRIILMCAPVLHLHLHVSNVRLNVPRGIVLLNLNLNRLHGLMVMFMFLRRIVVHVEYVMRGTQPQIMIFAS